MAEIKDDTISVLMDMTRYYDGMFDLNAMRTHALRRAETLTGNTSGPLDDDKGFIIEYSTMNHYLYKQIEEGKLSKEALVAATWEYHGETNIYPFYLWHTDKVTYRFDPDVEEVLAQQAQSFDEDMEIPAQVLEYLPHNIFFVKTGTSPLTKEDRKYVKKRHRNNHLAKAGQLGFFFHYGDVYVSKDGAVSKDPERKCIEFFVLSRKRDSAEVNVMPVSLIFSKGDTIRSMVGSSVADFLLFGETDEHSADYGAEYSLNISVLRWALQYVLYLCSENAELEQDPVNRQMYRHPTPGFVKNRPREVLLIDAGKKTGAMIHAFKQKRYEARSAGSATATTRSPHVRRAHWHHYWTGRLSHPEERRLVIKWVAPSYIHKEMYELIRPSVAVVGK